MKNFLLVIFSIVSIAVMAQKQFEVELYWNDIQSVKTYKGMEINYISFTGSTTEYQYASLPVFVKTLNASSTLFSYELEITDAVVDTLSAEESEIISDKDLIEENFVLTYSNDEIKILPLKYDLENNTIIRLLNFTILADLVPVPEEKQNNETINHVFANNSVLSEGKWIKMGIINTGIHKIERSDLLNMGVNPDNIDVGSIGIFGNYEGMLPESNEKERPDDLKENPAEYIGLEDGSFDEGDYILFYAQSQEVWKYNPFTVRFDHYKNIYADTVYYFFTPDMGTQKSLETELSLSVSPTVVVNSFVDYLSHENDIQNLMYSGKEWYGEKLTMLKPEISFTHNIPHLKFDMPIFFSTRVVARSYVSSSFKTLVNDDVVIDSTTISKVNPASEGIYAREATRSATFFANSNELNVKTLYNSSSNSASFWIDYYLMNFERDLIFDGGQMSFRQPSATGLGNITRFDITKNPGLAEVWDITDFHNAHKIEINNSDNIAYFTIATDSLREFICFDRSSFYNPVSYKEVENQNLHAIESVDFVIISPDELQSAANRLANIHEEVDNMNCLVVSPEEIYNEFSSGSQDVSAIRDFMRMLYEKDAFKNGPGYLLMFGDGSFDYKHRVPDNSNIVPTYESQESLRATQSYVTDDYFGLLDIDEGAYCNGELDIGIGRFPIKNIDEANIAVDKIERYLFKDKDNLHSWAQTICFVADDGDNNLHFKQADRQLVPIVDTLHPGLNINKIYSDAHAKVKIPGGYRFPEVNTKIANQVEEGALIVNYTGHGGLIGWSEELILDVPTINAFSNTSKLPLFITATCEFSRFDDPEFTSAGEYVFLNENGGGIALMTTTRLAYASANIILNMRLYNNLLKKEDGQIPRLGDMNRMAKNPSSTNFLNFTLLGDPALQLDFPQYEIQTLSVNNEDLNVVPDTLNAMSEVAISGRVVDEYGALLESFNGYVYPVVYDKPSQYTTLGNTQGSYPAEFELEDKILFKGKVTVKNGLFNFVFLIPKDISYKYGYGKISYYAMDTITSKDAWGGYNNIVIGGTDETVVDDGLGPDIELFINDRTFASGNEVSNSINILADFYDENGINVTGSSLGRDIVCIIDENSSNSMVLNEYYLPDVDTYKKGSLTYELGDLEPGMHTLSIRAWDLLNNSSTKQIEFVIPEGEKKIYDVYNYPNPFSESTVFKYNLGASRLTKEVELEIFDIRGRQVNKLKTEFGDYGAYVTELYWDGKDKYGNKLPHGLYLYKMLITDSQGDTYTIQQKMIKLAE
ncbi:MAG: hypothetical protein C0598_14130 [Marinilabiliales bacterium]|nr:MAG: hypothetical protein C0598_14130 [Marinilabiliales bacterium]